ncbi:hypothetical protein OPV22_017361 [Ensete ventricosum]|uniref:DEK-C domain-containing protein n=1 Tax=Ensete ventricosum TaxID=4639 RepID=A0AAV8QT15_ENSVE|nr:hypothetical protein OPV22_017361 [Ensete ventricosum]
MISKQNRRRFAVRSEGRVQLPPSQKVIGRKSGVRCGFNEGYEQGQRWSLLESAPRSSSAFVPPGMAEQNPSSDVEGTTMPNGSGLSPEGKTSVVVDSEKKEYAGKSIEVEEATIMNGSGPPTEDKSVVPNSGKNGNEGESIEEEKHVEEMMHSDEKKHGEENGIAKEVDIKTADVNTIKADDVKMVDAEAENAMEVENVKMVDGADFKDEKEGEGREEEGGEKEAKEEEEGGEGEEEEGGEEEAKEDEGKEDGDEEGGEQEAKEEKVGKEGEEGEGSKEEENNMEEGDIGSTEKKIDEDNEDEKLNKKRSRGQKADKKGEGKEGVTKARNSLSSPVTSSIERPVRERKTVERLVEVIEKEPSREFQVEKGRGIPLKDIPNVAYKLARKKPADIKLIHQTLFGRRGKAVNFKSHILQFSGFVWHESDEKQRAKMKEKLDKYVKDTLLDLCDLFDLPVSKANTRKEDLVAKLLDFLVAPHPIDEDVLSDDKQSMNSRKRKRVAKGSGSKSTEDAHSKQSRKKRTRREGTPSAEETDSEEDDVDDIKNGPYTGKIGKHSENECKLSDSEEASDEDERDEEDLGEDKQDKKKTPKQGSVGKEKKVGSSSRKVPTPAATKSPTKSSSSKHSKAENDDVGAKVFSRKRRTVSSPQRKSTPRSEKKEKDTGKKVSKGKAKSEAEHPSKEELRKKICEILKEVDFNTATFTDILKQLAGHYKLDLTPRKASIKLLIQEELTKLAEAEEDEDDEDEEDADKEENLEPTGKKVEA